MEKSAIAMRAVTKAPGLIKRMGTAIQGAAVRATRRAEIPKPKKMGLVKSTVGGSAIGGVGGAYQGATSAPPGYRIQGAISGAKKGATIGAVGGVGTRHVVNKTRNANYQNLLAKVAFTQGPTLKRPDPAEKLKYRLYLRDRLREV